MPLNSSTDFFLFVLITAIVLWVVIYIFHRIEKIHRIPKGDYCYDEYGVCPFWSLRSDRPEQYNGYCSYLKKGDLELNSERKVRDVNIGVESNAEDVGIPISLLWDKVKECEVNNYTEEEIEEMFKEFQDNKK